MKKLLLTILVVVLAISVFAEKKNVITFVAV